jgi:S1-C subfamily serine protease
MLVESLDSEGKVVGVGSGVVISPRHVITRSGGFEVISPSYVITNRHVIEGGLSFKVEHGTGNWSAELVRLDPDHDLAELSVDGLNAPSVRVRESSTLAVGERVYAIGAPEGLDLTISEGLISGLRGFAKARLIQTSAPISPGSSGGGLFDAEGRLVGITTFYLKEGQSLNFALPAEWALALKRQPVNAAPTTGENGPEFLSVLWFELGYKAGRAGDYQTALHAYEEAERLMPGSALVNLGVTYAQLGQVGKAISTLQAAVWLNPDDADAWYNLGVTYGYDGQAAKGASAYAEAVRLKPDYEEAWIALGAAYNYFEDFERALDAFQVAVRIRPDDARAWYNLGLTYRAVGQQSEVIKVYKKLKVLDPKTADEFFKKAVVP